jgi:hypothetical protein
MRKRERVFVVGGSDRIDRARVRRMAATVGALIVAVSSVATGSGSAERASTPWSAVPSPNSSGSGLTSVSCAGPTLCMAVGSEFSDLSGSVTQIDLWNGSTWSAVPSPNPLTPSNSPFPGGELSGVSCGSTTNCFAVGSSSGVVKQTLIESWNGTSWSIVSSPSVQGFLNGVSCSSAVACMALGAGASGQLFMSWNGVTWSVVPATTVPGGLNSVSCATPSSCLAVGTTAMSGPSSTLIESWNGTTWSSVTSPNVSPSVENTLSGVSCSGPTWCVAVGSYLKTFSSPVRTLIEAWNGSSWSIVPSVDPAGAQDVLNGVSCTGVSACTAAGFRLPGGPHPSQTLVESWNGQHWARIQSANTSPSNGDILNGVSCFGRLPMCFGVGLGREGFSFDLTLIESGEGAAPKPAKFVGAASGQVTCRVDASVLFSPPLTSSEGGTSVAVTGSLTSCAATTPGLTITSGKVSAPVQTAVLSCSSLMTGMPVSLDVSWKGRYDPPDLSFGGRASLVDSTVALTGEQSTTAGSGVFGYVAPGSGNSASVTGSFAASGPNGASAVAYTNLTPSQLTALCSPTPSRHPTGTPRPARGVKRLSLIGMVTIG